MSASASPLLVLDLDARRALIGVGASLAPLADSLSDELAPLLIAALPIPEQKARLTRFGGRCPEHGTFLEFDPWKPHDHWCVRCERPYQGQAHDEWWAMGAQLWTAERAVHAAALHALRGDPRHGALAGRILRAYAERYLLWPNKDNVLGPTRPFFSTYLESIWLLNLCHALALLEGRTDDWTATDAQTFRERVLEPSAALIASYHEGASNRQVWNEVALGSALRLLGRDDDARARLDVKGGIRWQIEHGLDAGGFWYEGENYHLFAHRGLWYGVQLMRALGEPLAPTLNAKYSAGFVAPFEGLLPDETFPSRRDSQYASSIRQWRTAEWCELGWVHTLDRRLAAVLSRLYDGRTMRRDTGRARSTADAERNTPASSLTRADLSWRALLMAEAAPPPAVVMPQSSVRLDAQGLAVIRRDIGSTYVALEGGELGGGHGHPDQLALTLQTGLARWLEDPGTGSYVEAELKWYRSTLAHAAPLVDRRSQPPIAATIVAFDEQPDAGWMVKRVVGMADGMTVERTIVVCDGYLVDVVTWEAPEPHTLELPIAGDAEILSQERHSLSTIDQHEEREDISVDFITLAEKSTLHDVLELRARATFADSTRPGGVPRVTDDAPQARVWYAVRKFASTDEGAVLMRAHVPATPFNGRTTRHWLVQYAARSCVVGVWSWPSERWPDGRVSSVRLTPDAMPCAEIITRDGETASHARVENGWRVTFNEARDDRRVVDLAGMRVETAAPAAKGAIAPPAPQFEILVPSIQPLSDSAVPGERIAGAWVTQLGEAHYVQTEQPWADAGAPTAAVQVGATPEHLVVDVHARTGALVTEVPDLLGRLDNEVPYVNADGLQWYIARADVPPSPARGWYAAALHVPSDDPALRAWGTEIRITGAIETVRTSWREVADGWTMRLLFDRAALPVDADGSLLFDLVINERPPDRERRRGQLVLSGGGGFSYLMGDRRPTNRFVRLVLPPQPAEATL